MSTTRFSSQLLMLYPIIGCFLLFAAGCKEKNTQSGKQGITPEFLRCEYLIDPEGIDAKTPRLSWYSESDEREQLQTACQILVSGSLSKLELDEADLWDSGKRSEERRVG